MRRATSTRIVLALVCGAVMATAACQKGAPKDILTNGKKKFSQFNEELIIRHYFDDRRGGTFVDVGAWHYRDGSTTYYLESYLGWTGIAVDAQDTVRKGYLDHRPGTRFFSYAVTDVTGRRVKFYIADQLSSTDREYSKAYEQVTQRPNPEIEVSTITLNDLLAREGVQTFDFLSMDIEDGEPAALAGFDIERFKPQLVCIEAHETVQEQLTKYFDAHHYERIESYLPYDNVNWYFRPKQR